MANDRSFTVFGQIVATILLMATAVFLILSLVQFLIPTEAGYAYVDACNTQYCVYIHTDAFRDARIQSFPTVQGATEYAQELNYVLSEYKTGYRK